MPKPKIICPDCDKEFKKVASVGKWSGHQLSRSLDGTYILYECPCGTRHWEYNKG